MIRLPSMRVLVTAVAVGLGAGLATAAELVSTHSDWKAYRHGQGRDRMCFAVTPAKEQQPADDSRRMPHVYVTVWPAQGVKSEISVLLGFAVKRDTDVTVDISGNTFTLFVDGDRAFVGDPAEEERLLDAMRRGVRMTIEAVSEKGTPSRDVFSLSGVTASVQAIAAGCS
jgi:hypothetical protein